MQLTFVAGEEWEGRRLSDFLRKQGLTAGLIRTVKYLPGGITADGNPAHTNLRLCAGQQITVTLPPEPETSVPAEALPLEILYEDDFIREIYYSFQALARQCHINLYLSLPELLCLRMTLFSISCSNPYKPKMPSSPPKAFCTVAMILASAAKTVFICMETSLMGRLNCLV